jgi:hypothetical protein
MSRPLYHGKNNPERKVSPGKPVVNKSIFDGCPKRPNATRPAATGSNIEQQGAMKIPLKSYVPSKVW